MPASAYSEYKHPETGEIIFLPQLFPLANSTGEISHLEMENWLNTGTIPQELYNSEIQAIQKIEEIRERLQNGEQVQTSELPCLSPLTEYLLKNKARLYGENVFIKIFARLDDSDYDIVWLSYVKESLVSISSEYPLLIHFHAAKEVLQKKYEIKDSKAGDILARELVDHCKRITMSFKSFAHSAFRENPIRLEHLNDRLENNGVLQIDTEFINFIRKIGNKGKLLSVKIKENCIDCYRSYKEKNYAHSFRRNLWGLWVPQNNEIIPPFLNVLAQVLWEDKCKGLWTRKMSGYPSVAKPVLDKMIHILNPKKNVKSIDKEGHLICYDQKGIPLFMAPAVDVHMISALQKGVKELGSLTGHKLLRWQVNEGFKRWQNGNKDPRLIEIDGGYSKIAELVGCKSSQEISKIREILLVQAHGNFIFPDGTYGNMLILRIDDRHKNSEPSKIRIILGDMLLPGYVCQLQRSDRRLIPIGDLPPLHGSYNSHASQAQLQLHVFSEFSNQSDRLARDGYVLIPLDRWKEMAHESGLNPEKIIDVIEYWSQPDLFNCFLERQGGEEFRLASYYENAQRFLEVQGQGRIINSERGKRSVEKRMKISRKN